MPKDLPDVIEIDVSELQIGDSIHIEDILEKYPDIEFLQPSNTTLVSILAPKMEVEEVEEEELEGEEAAEGAEETGAEGAEERIGRINKNNIREINCRAWKSGT